MINPPPELIVWCYSSNPPDLFRELRNVVEFVKGLPTADLLDERRTLLIIDDLMPETDRRVINLFTKGSLHMNASVVYISQSLYNKSKENRTISLNTHYLVLFKNPRDAAQISHLGRQIFSERARYFSKSFADDTSKPYGGYLLVSLKTTTPDHLRLRTAIFPDEECSMIVYVYK